MKINIEIIPHNQQRYETPGDWWLDKEGALQVRVSKMKDERYSALVAIHEIVEVLIESVRKTGTLEVPQSLVDAADTFDKDYEANRSPEDMASEPGYIPSCPVYEGHMAASAIEHIAGMLLRVDYNKYADEVEKLSKD